MRVDLHWDDPEQTIVRWEFDRWIGMVDYIIPINETASIGILNSGRADSILNIGMRLPFPNRYPRELFKPVNAARSYGLGYVVIVTRNPLAMAVIQAVFKGSDSAGRGLYIVGSLAAARQLIADLRADPSQTMQMTM
jgi:hypothetical protein